jgi:hypothetical protein
VLAYIFALVNHIPSSLPLCGLGEVKSRIGGKSIVIEKDQERSEIFLVDPQINVRKLCDAVEGSSGMAFFGTRGEGTAWFEEGRRR